MASPTAPNIGCGMEQFDSGMNWLAHDGGPMLVNPNSEDSPIWAFYILVLALPVVIGIVGMMLTHCFEDTPTWLLNLEKRWRWRFAPSEGFQKFLVYTRLARKGKVWSITPTNILAVSIVCVCATVTFSQAWKSMEDPLPDLNPPFAERSTALFVLFGRCMAHIGEFMLGVLLIPVTRNGLLVHTVGLPYDKAVVYHRYLGRAAVVFITLHLLVWWIAWWSAGIWVENQITYTGFYSCLWPNTTDPDNMMGGGNPTILAGSMAWGLMVVMAIFAVNWVRRNIHELFWISHRLFLLVIPLAAWQSFNSGGYLSVYVLFTGTMLVADILFRYGRSFLLTPPKVHIETLPGVTRLSYSKSALGSSYNAGQYCFVCIPEVSPIQWHPFSISSAPSDQFVTHHIKDMGAKQWTGRLRKIALEEELRLANEEDGAGHTEAYPRIFVDGPYGNPSMAAHSSQALLLIGGGIGITKLMSIVMAYHSGEKDPEGLSCIYLDWTVRDPGSFEWFSEQLAILQAKPQITVDGKILGFKIMLHCTKKSNETKGMDNVLETPLLNEDNHGGIVPNPQFEISIGRPNYDSIIQNVLDDIADGQLSVCCCGPARMVSTVSEVSLAHQSRVIYFQEEFLL